MKTSFRLDKYLADMSVGTRSEVKNLIKKGLVTVNGEVIRKPEYKVDIEKDDLVCRGEPVVYQTLVYYMLNKPAGVISATNDPKQQTVLDLITDKSRKDLFPELKEVQEHQPEIWPISFCHLKSMWIRFTVRGLKGR